MSNSITGISVSFPQSASELLGQRSGHWLPTNPEGTRAGLTLSALGDGALGQGR